MVPVALVGGVVLIVLSPTGPKRFGAVVYTLASLTLFGTSAAYHRGTWSPRVTAVLRRWDHANIFVFIAATYTPLTLALLHGRSRAALLTLIWSVAAAGVLFKLAWLSAPRWLYTVLYVLMGWAALGWLGQLWKAGGPQVVLLIVLGGLIYSLGALVYARKSPNPSPTWFGFHEIFHTCTILAAACHYAAIALASLI
jgi:hemolysin III